MHPLKLGRRYSSPVADCHYSEGANRSFRSSHSFIKGILFQALSFLENGIKNDTGHPTLPVMAFRPRSAFSIPGQVRLLCVFVGKASDPVTREGFQRPHLSCDAQSAALILSAFRFTLLLEWTKINTCLAPITNLPFTKIANLPRHTKSSPDNHYLLYS